MQTFSQKCLARLAVSILTLVLFPVIAQAGPTIHSAAQPDFQDPLSNTRPGGPATNLAIGSNADGGSARVRVQLETDIAPLSSNEQGRLEEVQTDEIARTVRNEFLGQGRPANQETGTGLGPTVDEPNGSSANIVRALINSVPGGPAGNAPNQTGQNSTGNSPTPSLLDTSLNNLIITILNPDLTTEDMVTFSIAGFGEFALLLLQESGGIFLVDLESGTAVKFSESGRDPFSGLVSATRGAAGQQDRAPSNALQRVLEILERNVLPIVTSPITLAVIFLFGIIWVFWRLSGRE